MSCSYCYNSGHNRRTCPELTRRLEANAAQGSDYAKTMLSQRGKGSGSNKANRKCSFCKVRGHDKRSCNLVKAYVDKKANSLHAYRTKFYDKMVENGFGVGSLISFNERDYNGTTNQYETMTRTALVRKILWNDISQASVNHSQQLVKVSYFYTNKDNVTKELFKHTSLPLCVSMWTHDLDGKKLDEIPPDSYRRKNASIILSPVANSTPDSSLSLAACTKAAKQYIKDYDLDVYSYEFRAMFAEDEVDALKAQNEKENPKDV
tara:strand:- start:956 stop:1744 length:789 start_codon:yes stop_codon:yes gene_type:complete